MQRLDIKEGDRFGRLVIVEELIPVDKGRKFQCKCDCGVEIFIGLDRLGSGHTQSCGCYRRDKTRINSTTHGKSHTKLYEAWCGMKHRCFYPGYQGYKYYGGRGISVCPEWMTFEPFYEWAMANGYQDGLTLERNNNDLGYSPANCRWIPKAEQPKNSRHNHMITHNGQTKSLTDWAQEVGICRLTLLKRLKRGWNINDALTLPVINRS